jgi:hypothetical protein
MDVWKSHNETPLYTNLKIHYIYTNLKSTESMTISKVEIIAILNSFLNLTNTVLYALDSDMSLGYMASLGSVQVWNSPAS